MAYSTRIVAGKPAGFLAFGCQLLGASLELSVNDSIKVIHSALDAGARFLDTANIYAPNVNWTGQGERIVGEALRRWSGPRDEVIIATKGGHVLGKHPLDFSSDGRPESLRRACEESLRALGVETIDLYQLHSIDPSVDIEHSMEALSQLQSDGKIKHIGLSNAGRRQAERALSVASIASIQNRYSVLSPQSRSVLDWCGEHGIAFLPYSPLGRDDAPNIHLRVTALSDIANRLGVSPQRVALAWLLSQGDHVLPIFGSTKSRNVLDSLAASDLELSEKDVDDISAIAKAQSMNT